jgi:hypothetical protein
MVIINKNYEIAASSLRSVVKYCEIYERDDHVNFALTKGLEAFRRYIVPVVSEIRALGSFVTNISYVS